MAGAGAKFVSNLIVLTMNTIKDRMKSYPEQTTNWEQLYVLTEHWKSDMQFYTDDLHFLNKLIDKYYIWIDKADHLREINQSRAALQSHQKKSKDLQEKIGKHMVQLGYLIENPQRADAGLINKEHLHLEEELTDFYKVFNDLRKVIRAKTEKLMNEEELNRFPK